MDPEVDADTGAAYGLWPLVILNTAVFAAGSSIRASDGTGGAVSA